MNDIKIFLDFLPEIISLYILGGFACWAIIDMRRKTIASRIPGEPGFFKMASSYGKERRIDEK